MKAPRRAVVAGLAVMAMASLAAPLLGWAQDRFDRGSEDIPPNPSYDGRFTFVRIRYDQSSDGGFGSFRRDIKWAHDYPRGERHFTKILGLRNYLLKGGFIIFDDFAGSQWENFTAQMRRVFPDLQPMRMTPDDKVFDAFYHITTLNYNHPYFGVPAEFWGIYENNDRDGRLMAMINYNNDLSEYWEFSDEQFFPVNMSNDAYKLGINYLVYALTR